MTPWELQKAIFTRLNAFAALTALIDAIYDHVPQDPTFPYLQIGDDTSVPFDTHDSQGSDNTITIHSWSRYRGKSEIKQIQRETYNALHRFSLVVTGVTTVDCEWEFADSFKDPDGITRHGVQRFRVMLDEG